MGKKIYVVVELNLSCNFKQLVCAFSNEEEALKIAKEMKKKTKQERVFDDDIWNSVEEELIDWMDSLDEDKYINPYVGGTDEWYEWNKDFDKFANEKYVNLLHQHGLTDATVKDVEKQMDYKTYHGKVLIYQVEEITLFE